MNCPAARIMRRLVPAVSNSTSSSASPPIGWIFETTPEPNARGVTRSPTAKAGAALPAGFAAGGAGRLVEALGLTAAHGNNLGACLAG